MFDLLEIMTSFIVVVLGLSLLIMTFTQIAMATFNFRGRHLSKGITKLLENIIPDVTQEQAKDLSHRILSHPLVSDTYINGKNALSLGTAITKDELFQIIKKFSELDINKLQNIDSESNDNKPKGTGIEPELVTLLKDNLKSIEKEANRWFDSAMARVGQYYQKNAKVWTICFSILFSFYLHLDASFILTEIAGKPELRKEINANVDKMLAEAEFVIQNSKQLDEAPMVVLNGLINNSQNQEISNNKEILLVLLKKEKIQFRFEVKKWLESNLKVYVSNHEGVISDLMLEFDTNLPQVVKPLTASLIKNSEDIRNLLPESKLLPVMQVGEYFDGGPTKHFFGVTLMVALLSLGAPFWFNLLKTVSSLRSVTAENESKTRNSSGKVT